MIVAICAHPIPITPLLGSDMSRELKLINHNHPKALANGAPFDWTPSNRNFKHQQVGTSKDFIPKEPSHFMNFYQHELIHNTPPPNDPFIF